LALIIAPKLVSLLFSGISIWAGYSSWVVISFTGNSLLPISNTSFVSVTYFNIIIKLSVLFFGLNSNILLK